MDEDTDISILIADKILKYIYDNYQGITCGDYISICSVLCFNVSQWIGKSMGEKPDEIFNAIMCGAIRLEKLHEENNS